MASYYGGVDTSTILNVTEADSGNALDGVESMPRGEITAQNAAFTTARVQFIYFTPVATKTCAQMILYSGTTAAAATPTLVRAGFYTVAGNGDITLVCAIASDTTLFAAPNTEYTRAFSTGGGLPASYQFAKGTRYAAAQIVINTGSPGSFPGNTQPPFVLTARAPKMTGHLGSQTDLPASVVSASIAQTTVRFYCGAIA